MKLPKFECWNVAFRKHDVNFKNSAEEYIVIPNTWRYWAADPFICYKDSKYYIIAELYDRLTFKGKIGYCILDDNGKILKKWKMVINSDVHMSFPNIIEINKKITIMPESSKANELRYYRANDFSSKWVLDKVLIRNAKLADTIYLNDNILMAYDNYSNPKKLLIYKKEENNIKLVYEELDLELKLRPAGQAFYYDKKIIVPLQNCDGEYGKSIYLTQVDFHERENTLKTKIISEISSDNVKIKNFGSKIYGMHTYNFSNKYEVIDIKTREFNIVSMIGLIIKKITKGKDKHERKN